MSQLSKSAALKLKLKQPKNNEKIAKRGEKRRSKPETTVKNRDVFGSPAMRPRGRNHPLMQFMAEMTVFHSLRRRPEKV